MVSPFMGMGGRDGLCCCGGACPATVLVADCSPNKITKAIAGNKDFCFLFIQISFVMIVVSEIEHTIMRAYKTKIVKMDSD